MAELSHWGNDQMGASTQHKGERANCPAPECEDGEELTPAVRARNAAEGDLFQLAAYGHHKYPPMPGVWANPEYLVKLREGLERLKAAHAHWLAEEIRAATAGLKAHGVLEPDKFRPCRDAANQIDPEAVCHCGLMLNRQCPVEPGGCNDDGNGGERRA